MTLRTRLLSAVAAALILAAPVHAAVAAFAVRTVFVLVLAIAPGPTLLPLTDGGATSVTFSGKGRHLVGYSAECAKDGGPGDWVSIQILVDGAPLAPTGGTDDAFCSGNTTPWLDGWVVAHYDVATPVLANGTHTVQVQASATTGTARLDDTSLIITK